MNKILPTLFLALSVLMPLNLWAQGTQEMAKLASAEPEDGSFNLPTDMKNFVVTFTQPVDVTTVVATLGGETLTVAPAEGYAEVVTLTRTGEGDLSGVMKLVISEAVSEGSVPLDNNIILNYSFGPTVDDPNDIAEVLVPVSYFEECANGGIPVGYNVYLDGDIRQAGNTYGSNARVMTFSEGGDFTRAIYYRQEYITYGEQEEYPLTLIAGKEYTFHFNTAQWKENGIYTKFELLNAATGEVVYTKVVQNSPNLNGKMNFVVEGSTVFNETIAVGADGNYIMKWTAASNENGDQGSWNEMMLGNVYVEYIPNVLGLTETKMVNEALEAAKKNAEVNNADRYYGTAYVYLLDKIAEYENVTFTAPSACQKAADELNAAAKAMTNHRTACDTYDSLSKEAQDLVIANANKKFAVMNVYTTLKATAAKYIESQDEIEGEIVYTFKVLTDDAELAAAITELQDITTFAKAMFTEGASSRQKTGVAALIERLRLGAEGLRALGVALDDPLIVAANEALDDNDALAEQIKIRTKTELYGKLKETDNNLFTPFLNDSTGENVVPTYDMSLFVKNPNMYARAKSLVVSGWSNVIGNAQAWSSWGTDNHSESTPYAEDCALHPGWHSVATVEQTITDLPAGVYTIKARANDNSEFNDGNYLYVKLSSTPEVVEGDEVDVNVNYAAYTTFDHNGWDREITGVEVVDGVLTIGCTWGSQSQAFFDEVHLEMTAPIDGYDYTAAYEAELDQPHSLVATPTFSWNGDELTISTTTEDAAIYYTNSADVSGAILSMINNGSAEGDDLSSFPVSYDGPNNVGTASDSPEIVEGTGVGGSRCFKVTSYPNPTETWHTQLYIKSNEVMERGTKWKLMMSIKADHTSTITTSAHGQPRQWKGSFVDAFTVSDQWTEYTWTGEIGVDDFQTIAFDLSNGEDGSPGNGGCSFYFDNIQFGIDLGDTLTDSVPIRYTGPFTVTQNAVITAWAEHEDMLNSEVVTLDYPYTSWKSLTNAIANAESLVEEVQDNLDVADQCTELAAMITSAQASYRDRTDSVASITSMTNKLIDLMAAIRQQIDNPDSRKRLTADMLYAWDSFGPNAQRTGPADICEYILDEPAECAYGDSNVKNYADLSSYSRLEVTVTEGTPRFLFNRENSLGLWSNDETQSRMIEYPNEGWSSKYFLQEGNVWVIDLKQMVADKGYAHLHAIKSSQWGEQVTVTKMELVGEGENVFPEAYAVLTTDTTSVMGQSTTGISYGQKLTFYYDIYKGSHEGAMSINSSISGSTRGWDSNATNITTVEFSNSFANCLTLTSTASWFSDCTNLSSVIVANKLRTDYVTNMQAMFFGCSSLTELDLSNLNTAKVSTMQQMFSGCSALKTIFVGSGWTVENLSDSEIMFEGCSSLVGGEGTAYDSSHTDYTYACIDKGADAPGYFTGKIYLTDMYYAWDSPGAGAQITGPAACEYVIGSPTDIPYGNPGVQSLYYADLSAYSWLELTVTDGTPRFLFNRDVDEGQWDEDEAKSHMIESTKSGWSSKYFVKKGDVWAVNLKRMVADKGYAHLHAIKSGAWGTQVTVTRMELFKGDRDYTIMGDANDDGFVNIADAVATVTNILGVPTDGSFNKEAADMNKDDVIDIFDVTLIVNAAFDAASPAPAMTRGSASNIMMENVSMTVNADDIYLGVDQPERFTAMQFDVTLPEGTELVHVRLASATTDHQLSFVKRGKNEYRVIGLSLSNATFRSLDGQLIKLEVSGSAVGSDVKMSNVLFVKPSGKTVTGIEAVQRSTFNVQLSTCYDLKGQKLVKGKQQLGKGIYIENGRKVIIK